MPAAGAGAGAVEPGQSGSSPTSMPVRFTVKPLTLYWTNWFATSKSLSGPGPAAHFSAAHCDRNQPVSSVSVPERPLVSPPSV